MSLLYNEAIIGAAGQSSGYEIKQSVKFDDNRGAYLNRTPGTAGNRKTWTWSGWLKLGALSQQRAFFAGSTANNDAGFTSIEIRNDNKLYVSGYNTTWRISTQLFRDPSAWYHIVIVWDTTQATANDRIKVYLNGSQITDFDTTNNPSQDATGGVNGAAAHYISTYDGSNWEWDGYLAEVNFIDGSALDPTDFGEYDDNGVWRPIKYAGSYTGNSFYLKFEQGALGTDSSGLGNNWTTNELWEEIGTPDYAGNWIGSTSGSFYSGSWENVFNGDVTVGSNYIYAYQNTATLTFSTALSGVIEVFGSDGGAGDTNSGYIALSDGSSWSINSVARANAQWHSFGSKSNITTITVSSPGGHGAILGAIRVDGNLLANISAKANYVNMADTPTTNWCTLNPLNTGAAYTLSNGNLEFTSSTNWDGTTGTFVVSSGKWYYEFTRGSGTSGLVGWCEPQNYDVTTEPGDPANSSVWRYRDDGTKRNGEAGGQSYGATWTSVGDVIGCALDLDAGTIAFYKNGSSQGTAYSNLSGKTLVPVIGFYNCTIASSVNFGQRDFEYTPPTGFKALNTSNLPAPEIKDGTKYFNTVLYSGTGTSNSITGVGFSPDFVWLRPRDNADHHRLNTTTQGANRALSSNLQDAEYGPTNAYLDSFDSDGFTVSSNDNGWNNTGYNYVSWNWKEGAVPGFEIVTYTGNGYPTSNTQNISHNLGVAPSFITIKNRSRSSQWLHYVKPLGATKGLEGWHDGDSAYTNANYFNNTEPTSTQFTVGTDSGGNWQGDNFIAYLWAEVDGFFKVGTYERNGSTDGPFIYLGFTPALIIIKEYAAGTEGWPIYDNKRLGYNPNDTPMFINSTNTESYIQTTYPNEIDFLSNGFKIRNNDSRQNSTVSSYRYLYWAWAVNPFGGDGVSPATAR